MLTGIACFILGLVAGYSIILKRDERTEDAVARERHRVSTYLRHQAMMAEVVSKCRYLSRSSRDQEGYASAVLEETAFEIDTCAHHIKVAP